MKKMTIYIILLLASFGLSCSDFLVNLPKDAEQFNPPLIYKQWFKETEHCSQRLGNFDDITWFVVPNSNYVITSKGEQVAAYWSITYNYVIMSSKHQMNPYIVRHEMLHAILQISGHPPEFFIDRCHGLIVP